MNKKAQINMSLIPLVLILAVILGAGYFLIQGDIKLPEFNKGPQIKRLDGFPTVIYTDEDLEKDRRVIKSEEELYDFLNKVDKTGLTTPKEKIDFENEYVLAASSESKLPVGHELKIKKLTVNDADKVMNVSIVEIFPGETCEIEEDKHIAVDLVAITKTDYEIRFDREVQTDECR